MDSEIRSNGCTEIRLRGERAIEKLAIAEILEAADKGQRIKLMQGEPGELIVRLEHEAKGEQR